MKNEKKDVIERCAKFGDMFRTRDGRKAVFLGWHFCIAMLHVEGLQNKGSYLSNGRRLHYKESRADIVGKWEEGE